VCLGVLLLIGSRAAPAEKAEQPSFSRHVQPFLARHCHLCHNDKARTAAIDVQFTGEAEASASPLWEDVAEKIRTGQMPPPDRPKPPVHEIQAVTRWIEDLLKRPDRIKPDPGRVTARRLNRSEYNNTLRDLLAVDFRPADDFPADDAGYGFDNIGDVLSLSPVLMEKYMSAARQAAELAIGSPESFKPVMDRYSAEQLKPESPQRLETRHRFPADAEYEIRAGLGGFRPEAGDPLKLTLSVDGADAKSFDVDPARGKPRTFETRIPIRAGTRSLRLEIKPAPMGEAANRERNVVVDYVEVRGPFQTASQEPRSYRRVFLCGHPRGLHEDRCARTVVANLAWRAWRRPVTDAEIDKLTALVSLAQKEGEPLEAGVRVALQAILVSPHFLFRIERDPDPYDPGAAHPISQIELASRLSYFLWSSTPDEELLRAAKTRVLRQPEFLRAQVKRMLMDPRSEALVDNFAGQWLQLRNLESLKPDPGKFPEFDAAMRDAMYRETRLFFEAILREDRSILEFLDARFTYVNERLARHYGIPGVSGPEFQRVALAGGERGGLLGHASVLTISSYPTRTSPVLRGKWVLENLLGAPPPPPPPGVPELETAELGLKGTLRQQMEQHRANPACAVCHAKMDAIGFGLENYDPIGRWRTHDGNFLIDASGEIAGKAKFSGPAELRSVLSADPEAFTRCLTEKMLTYALGRGLERYDRPAVQLICRKLGNESHRFTSLIFGIVESMPFQMRRGDGGKR
jgi:hypothetical protein